MMKILFIILFSLSSFAGENESCKKLVEQVLNPALYEVLEGDNAGYHFISDEKSALQFIQNYEASKLDYGSDIRKVNDLRKKCNLEGFKKLNKEHCQSEFPNYNFLKALIFAMKNNDWQPSTVNLAHQKIKDYFKTVIVEGNSPFNTLIAATLLKIYATEFPSKTLDPKEAMSIKMEADKAFDTYQKKTKNKSNTSCTEILSAMDEEGQMAAQIQKKLSKIIARL